MQIAVDNNFEIIVKTVKTSSESMEYFVEKLVLSTLSSQFLNNGKIRQEQNATNEIHNFQENVVDS